MYIDPEEEGGWGGGGGGGVGGGGRRRRILYPHMTLCSNRGAPPFILYRFVTRYTNLRTTRYYFRRIRLYDRMSFVRLGCFL